MRYFVSDIFAIVIVSITISVDVFIIIGIAIYFSVCIGVGVVFGVVVVADYFSCRNSYVDILSTFITLHILASVNGTIVNLTKTIVILISRILRFCGDGGGG